MSRKPKPPVFLQRASYRQRRLRDGAKLLPFIGVVLWSIPLAWGLDADGSAVGARGLLYIFGVWVLMIILTALFASRMRPEPADASADDPAP